MQNYCKTIGAVLAASTLVAGTASAEVEYELHTGYTSEYLWRGLNLGQDLVEAGADASFKCPLTGLDLSVGAWYGSYDTLGEYDIDELDIYAEASKDLGFATAAIGYIWYHNEDWLNIAPDAQEVYFSLGRDLGFASASLTYYWDIEGDNDGYSELALAKSIELNSCLSLGLGTSIGYLVEQGQATAWTTKASLDWGFAENAKLSPFVAFSLALSDDSDTAYWGSKNQFVAGSMLSVSF